MDGRFESLGLALRRCEDRQKESAGGTRRVVHRYDQQHRGPKQSRTSPTQGYRKACYRSKKRQHRECMPTMRSQLALGSKETVGSRGGHHRKKKSTEIPRQWETIPIREPQAGPQLGPPSARAVGTRTTPTRTRWIAANASVAATDVADAPGGAMMHNGDVTIQTAALAPRRTNTRGRRADGGRKE